MKRLVSALLVLCLTMALPALAEDEEKSYEAAWAVVPGNETQRELGYSEETSLLTVDGLVFKDLNDNGELDPYEDWRLDAETRADDLLAQMTDTDKAAQMLHMTMLTVTDSWFSDLNVGFVLAYTSLSESPAAAVAITNYVQALSEQSRLGIPVVLSMDSVNGASWINGTTMLPDQLTLAAAGDAEIVRQLADIQRLEMKALGIRMSLSPVADIATDPRWGRVQECFGEDADMAARMVAAAVDGLQAGSTLTSASVMACVKHFPGSGAQTAGVDGSPLVYDEETFEMHLNVFRAAIEAGAASIMPYGYSTVPYLGGDAVDHYAHESATVMTELLRGTLGYEGIIQTDWGLNHTFAALAGADALGGAGKRETKKLVENLTTEQFDSHVRRLLLAKFDMGLFENPYSDPARALEIVGSEEHYLAVKNAALKAMTLVKYENAVSLEGRQLIVAGSLAEDAQALSSGWRNPDRDGKTIVDALIDKAGADKVTYIGDDASKIAASYPEGTVAVVIVGEGSGTHVAQWGDGTLEFPETQTDLVKGLKAAGATVVSVVLMNRAYVLTPIADASDCVMLAYRPGMTAGADAVAEALLGESPITGKTPFQIPASMSQVLLQREDRAKDIVDPLYDFGYGISVDGFGR